MERGKDHDAFVKEAFPFNLLPFELQQAVLAFAIGDADVSITSLLSSCPAIHDASLPLLYNRIHINSIRQAISFDKAEGTAIHASKYARTFTFTLVGVPGGSTRGGRESAPSSPPSLVDSKSVLERTHGNERLLLAAKVASLCPSLEHFTIEMFGKRHSTLLTSADYLAEEANTFRNCLAQLQKLQSFAWITPRVNYNFVGFSVAVVDLALAPLIEGLQAAAVDMTSAGRRVSHEKGSLNRFAHSLSSVTLQHCFFPATAYANESLFYLFAQTHPDDEDWLLFPCLHEIRIRTAINVDPRSIAYLVLTWQLRLDDSTQDMLSVVERHQRRLKADWNPTISLSDPFVKSIWGPRLTVSLVREHVTAFVSEAMAKDADQVSGCKASPPMANSFLEALEEADALTHLSMASRSRIASLTTAQRNRLIGRACNRVRITLVADAIAGVQGASS